MTDRRFYVARNPDVRRVDMLTARSYSRIEDAFADMHDGLVFDTSGDIVAFHERHEALIFHRDSTRMTHA